VLHHAVEVEVSVKLLGVLINAPVSKEDTAVETVLMEKNTEDIARSKSWELRQICDIQIYVLIFINFILSFETNTCLYILT